MHGERRVREQAVPVVCAVQAVRAGAVRAVLAATSMWQRGGWDAPENNPGVPAAVRPHHASLL